MGNAGWCGGKGENGKSLSTVCGLFVHMGHQPAQPLSRKPRGWMGHCQPFRRAGFAERMGQPQVIPWAARAKPQPPTLLRLLSFSHFPRMCSSLGFAEVAAEVLPVSSALSMASEPCPRGCSLRAPCPLHAALPTVIPVLHPQKKPFPSKSPSQPCRYSWALQSPLRATT